MAFHQKSAAARERCLGGFSVKRPVAPGAIEPALGLDASPAARGKKAELTSKGSRSVSESAKPRWKCSRDSSFSLRRRATSWTGARSFAVDGGGRRSAGDKPDA